MSDRAVPPQTYLDALGRRLDLDTCAQEPIHIPGAVQPFGALLVLNEGDLVIRQASRITQVLYNLIAIALTFTPSGGLVSVRARVDGPALRVEVADTGPGLRPEDHERVFTKFFQTRESETGTGGQTKGSGLGLARAACLGSRCPWPNRRIRRAAPAPLGVDAAPSRQAPTA